MDVFHGYLQMLQDNVMFCDPRLSSVIQYNTMSEKKKGPKEEPDESTLKLLNVYRKKCDQNGVTQVKAIRDRIEAAVEDGKLESLQLWDDLGPIAVRALMESFGDIGYKHLKKLRLWKVKAQDEGMRVICNFVDKCNTLEYLDLLDNEVSPLGCEFLCKTLINSNCSLIKLKLAHNNFGTQGLKNLSSGLAKNSTLQKFNVKYCQIDQHGIKYIQQMLANINTNLLSLKLQGNPIKDEGLYELLRALESNDTLEKINIADIEINLLEESKKTPRQKEIQQKLLEVIEKNKSVWKWDLRFNLMTDGLASAILTSVGLNDGILKLELPETVSIEVRQRLANAVKKRKSKKKNSKGGKAKPKKK